MHERRNLLLYVVIVVWLRAHVSDGLRTVTGYDILNDATRILEHLCRLYVRRHGARIARDGLAQPLPIDQILVPFSSA